MIGQILGIKWEVSYVYTLWNDQVKIFSYASPKQSSLTVVRTLKVPAPTTLTSVLMCTLATLRYNQTPEPTPPTFLRSCAFHLVSASPS